VKAYLSYPMSGQPDHGIGRATRVAALLREQGYDLVVPHEIEHGGPGRHFNPKFSHGDYIREDVRRGMLADGVDAIFLVDGWTHSKGAMAEFQIAVAMGFRIFQVIEAGIALVDVMPIDGKGWEGV
jgi:hypothetical protein